MDAFEVPVTGLSHGMHVQKFVSTPCTFLAQKSTYYSKVKLSGHKAARKVNMLTKSCYITL